MESDANGAGYPAAEDWCSRVALARLALSAAARSLADEAALLVPTVTDEAAGIAELVHRAHRLVEATQRVLVCAAVHAREAGASWTEIGAALGGISKQSAFGRYHAEVQHWDDKIRDPWEHKYGMLVIRLPEGADMPTSRMRWLDRWCEQHIIDAHTDTRRCAERDGIVARMVSARLPGPDLVPHAPTPGREEPDGV